MNRVTILRRLSLVAALGLAQVAQSADEPTNPDQLFATPYVVDWLGATNVQLVATYDVLDDLHCDFVSRGQAYLPYDISLGFPHATHAGPLACVRDCEFFDYELIPVPPAGRERFTAVLEHLKRAGPIRIGEQQDIFSPDDSSLNLVAYVVAAKPTNGKIPFETPEDWTTILHDQDIESVWVAVGAILDRDGYIIEKLPQVRPIAIITRTNIYRAREFLATADFSKDLTINGFPLFRLEMPRDQRRIGTEVMDVFTANLRDRIENSPLLAPLYPAASPGPARMVFRREAAPSVVLRAALGPLTGLFELSSYTFTWHNSTYERDDYDSDLPPASVKISALHELAISADGVHFQEETRDPARMKRYVLEYRKAVIAAFREATASTCRQLRARVACRADGVIVVKEAW